MMFVDGLTVPKRLVALIDRGLWPRTDAEELKQNLESLVPIERIHSFAPEESTIYLVKPPFQTVAERSRNGEEKFWSRFAAPEGILPDLCVFIGNFGIGSDSPILLDYRQDRSNPSVIRLKLRQTRDQSNVWVRCSKNFDEFADMLGLDRGDTETGLLP